MATVQELEEAGFDTSKRDVNHMEILESHFFNLRSAENYRVSAIDAAAKRKWGVQNTSNNTYELTKMLISVKCPYCKHSTTPHGGGGNGASFSTTYNCSNEKCKGTVSVCFSNGDLSARYG